MKDYEIPGEARKPIGSLKLGSAREALLLLSAAQTAWYNGQVALTNLKIHIAQRLLDTALYLEEQIPNTTSLATKVDLAKQADVIHAKVVSVLYDLERPSNDDTINNAN